MKRICVQVTDEQAIALKKRAEIPGVRQAEQIRRAIDDLPSPELIEQGRADPRIQPFWQWTSKQETRTQPVLITQKAGE